MPGEEAWGLYLDLSGTLVHLHDRAVVSVEERTPLVFYVPDGESLEYSDDKLQYYADNQGQWEIAVQSFKEAPNPRWYQGVSLTSYSVDGYCSQEVGPLLEKIKGLGANTVQFVVVYATDGARIFPADHSPREYCLSSATRLAQEAGLQVSWNLHVDPVGGEWRGAMQPKDKQAFLLSYRTFSRFFAELAQDKEVDLLVPATEMVSMMEREEDRRAWASIFLELHTLFFGDIVYGADRTEYGYLGEAFWDACCDFIGLTAWYALSDQDRPSDSELERAWKPIVKSLKDFSNQMKMRMIIIEGPGYRLVEGCAKDPAEYRLKHKQSEACQAESYRAFLREFSEENRSFLAGHFAWEVTAPGEEESDYSPLGRLAESWLKQAWSSSP